MESQSQPVLSLEQPASAGSSLRHTLDEAKRLDESIGSAASLPATADSRLGKRCSGPENRDASI